MAEGTEYKHTLQVHVHVYYTSSEANVTWMIIETEILNIVSITIK